MSKQRLRKIGIPSLLVAIALAAGMALSFGPKQLDAAVGDCGKCTDGTTGPGYSCSGAPRNCSECTVCTPPPMDP